MDYQEAIEIIQYAIAFNSENSRLTKALDVAISAMQELQEYSKTGLSPKQVTETICELGATKRVLEHYKQLGTLEEVREAVEKQKKKKPKGDLHSVPHYRCPNCNSTVKLYQNSKKDEICKWCGQRIEWSEVENER